MSLRFLGLKFRSPSFPRARVDEVSPTTLSPAKSNVEDGQDVLIQRLHTLIRTITESEHLSDGQITEMHALLANMEAISRQESCNIVSIPLVEPQNSDSLSILKRRHDTNPLMSRNVTSPLIAKSENSEGRSPVSIRRRRGTNNSDPLSSPITPKRFFRTPSSRNTSMSRASTAKHSPTIRSPLRNKGNSSSAKLSLLDDDIFRTPPAFMTHGSPLPRFDFESTHTPVPDDQAAKEKLMMQQENNLLQMELAVVKIRSATSDSELEEALAMMQSAKLASDITMRDLARLAEQRVHGKRVLWPGRPDTQPPTEPRFVVQGGMAVKIRSSTSPIHILPPMLETDGRARAGSELRVQKIRPDLASLEERRRQSRPRTNLLLHEAKGLLQDLEGFKDHFAERKKEIDVCFPSAID